MSRLVPVAVALAIAAAGCGGDAKGSSSSGPLVVSAAASLQKTFTSYGRQFGAVRFSFAGSDQLAAQIRQGVKPDVFASANTTLPDALYADGLVEKPTVFAGNRLVLAVPAKSAIASLAGVERSGATLAIGSATAPIGAYTRKVLARLPPAASTRVLANVRSEEPDVSGIVGKLTQGAVDAGFVYVTDVAATHGALKAIELPAALQPAVKYEVAVVKGARHRAQARRFIAGLLSGAGRQALRAAGFELP
jgi:molybdate transport system substrate-binding protein